MHKEILTEAQVKLLPLVKKFSKDFCLVGGTAIALHIGHRRSVDFDLFTAKEFDNAKIRKEIVKNRKIERVFRDEIGQYSLSVFGVRFTFLQYPFRIRASKNFDAVIALPDLLTLAAMKAYALGRRAKWKDYVDMYFIMRDCHTLKEIVRRAKKIFGREFNEKMFRAQLAYFRDIDYSEKVIYMKGFKISDSKAKSGLIDFSLS